MTEARFRSDIAVSLVPEGTCGSDRLVACRAWAEHPDKLDPKRDDSPAGWRRVIRAMVRGKHTTPFEAGKCEFFLEAPGVVWWQLCRHRFMSLDAEDFGANVESGRYKVQDGVFYLPPRDRPMIEPPGFRPMQPRLDVVVGDIRFASIVDKVRHNHLIGWDCYQRLVDVGLGREVARLVLPQLSLYVSGYFGGNPLTVLTFLEQRTSTGADRSHPQHEIEEAARQVEGAFRDRFPIVHSEWDENGRRFGGTNKGA